MKGYVLRASQNTQDIIYMRGCMKCERVYVDIHERVCGSPLSCRAAGRLSSSSSSPSSLTAYSSKKSSSSLLSPLGLDRLRHGKKG